MKELKRKRETNTKILLRHAKARKQERKKEQAQKLEVKQWKEAILSSECGKEKNIKNSKIKKKHWYKIEGTKEG
jgi:hypothetical protein